MEGGDLDLVGDRTERTSLWAWAVCGILLLATMLNYMDRQALAVMLPTLKEDFSLNETRIGYLEYGFGVAFACGSIFFGLLADRWGPKFLYPAVLIGWSFAGIATAFASSDFVLARFQLPEDPPGTGVFRWIFWCRIFLGFFEAGHWPCALLTVRAITTTRDRTLGNGVLQSGASIGAILVPLYIEAATRAGQGWNFSFWSIGFVGLSWVPAWFLLTGRYDFRAHLAEVQIDPKSKPEEPLQLRSLAQRVAVLFVIVASLTVSWQFIRVWFVLFLQDHHHYSELSARLLTSGYFIAADVGCILSGVLVSQLLVRGWTMHSARLLGYFVFSLLTACAALVPFVEAGSLMIAMLFITGAGILGLHPYYYALTQELSQANLGKVVGSLAASGWIVSALAQRYLGEHIKETKSYALGLMIVGLVPFAGFLALAFFWPRPEKAEPRQ